MSRNRVESLEARRLLAALVPDVTWADDGFVDRTNDHVFVGTSGGGILVSDSNAVSDEGRYFTNVTRYTADGAADPSFHAIRIDGDNRILIDADGRLLVGAGDFDTRTLRLSSYAANGDADSSFGDDGTLTLSLGEDATKETPTLAAIASAPDGSLYVDVRSAVPDPDNQYNELEFHKIFKVTAGGDVDKSFGTDGSITRTTTESYGSNAWLAVDSTGRLLSGVEEDFASSVIERFTADGTRDTTYGNAGHEVDFNGLTFKDSFALDGQDRLLALEQIFTEPTEDSSTLDVRRFTADGQPDTTFGDNGVAEIDPDAGDRFAGNEGPLLLQSNGKIVTGKFEQIVRLNADGTPDTTFGDNGAYDEPDSDLVGQLPDGSLLANASSPAPRPYTQSVAKLAEAAPVAVGRSGALYLTGTYINDDFLLGPTKNGKLGVALNGQFVGAFTGITAVRADLGDGNNSFVDNYFQTTDLPESVTSGTGSDSVVTGGGADTIEAGNGDNTIVSGVGDDSIVGGRDNDSVSSGDGYDTIDVGSGGTNIVDGGSGGGSIEANGYYNRYSSTKITGNGGKWTVDSLADHNDITLTGESAYIDLAGSANGSVVKLDTTLGDTVYGSYGNDSITTGGGDDFIGTRTGRDTVSSGAGNDTVGGASYLDQLDVPSADRFDLGPGDDVARVGTAAATIVGGDGDDSIRTGTAADSIDGGDGRDTIRAGDGDDTLTGGGGRDRLYGQAGADLLRGQGNADVLCGGLGDDTLLGGGGDDLLIAGLPNAPVPAAHNTLDGGFGSDVGQREGDADDVVSVESLLTAL